MKLDFKLFGREYHFALRVHRPLNQYVAGITNKCADGRYVLFLDYDAVPVEWVLEECEYLQDEHCLGDLHVFRTGNGYHVICTQKFNLRELLGVMRDSSTDAAYLNVSLRRARRVWTLRTSEKNGSHPEFYATLPGIRGRRESAPHNEILRKLYKIIITGDYEDQETKFLTAHYHIAA